MEREPVIVPGTVNFLVTTICGSMRFWPEMLELAQKLSRAGWIVLMPFVTFTPEEQRSDEKWMLDDMHLRKIDMSNAIHVVRTGKAFPGPYIGESTQREIEYATRKGRTVIMSDDKTPPA